MALPPTNARGDTDNNVVMMIVGVVRCISGRMGPGPSSHAVMLLVVHRCLREESGPGKLKAVCRGDRARSPEAPTWFSRALTTGINSRGSRGLWFHRRALRRAVGLPQLGPHAGV